MRFRVLGPLRVHDGANWMPVPAAQQRLLLAVLLTDPDRVVSTPRLIDELWGENPPPTAVNTIQVYVMRLRRLLGDGLLVTHRHGYELVTVDDDVDAAEFERLVTAGRDALADERADTAVEQLSQALALWQGPALADVPATLSLSTWAARVEQDRMAVTEERAAALLALGRHDEVVDVLYRLVGKHPLRERPWALLMQALHESGRRADALETYHRARLVLRDELGLEPSPRLRELQRTILAEEPKEAATTTEPAAPRAAPAQLPADVPGFTGRAEPLKQLDAALPAEDDPTATAVLISVIAGAAGVGKTALAVHWAHRVRARFGDGQLYVNLRGYAPGRPVRPVEALGQFLRALGVPAEQVPSDVDEAGALYRTLLAGRRVLVLLDNAHHSDQVRPLLPGSPGCLAVVTSRDRLDGLVARDGAIPLTLDVFTDDEAHDLLTSLLGADRVSAETSAAADLAQLCGHLPLALRIAAANLATRPRGSITAFTARLAGDRLGGLDLDGDAHAGVRATFDLSYAALPEPARRLFRLLGLVPGPDVTAPAAAALTGDNPASAARLLARLAIAHVVDEHAPDRYGLHDLIRHYAAERAAAEEPEPEQRAALARLYDHYVRHTRAAVELLTPEMVRLPYTDPNPARFGGESDAFTWLDAERPNLVAAVWRSAQDGPYETAWRLADVLRGYFALRMSLVDWQVAAEAGLIAAEADGDDCALAAGHISLASFHHFSDRHVKAIEHYTQALVHAKRAVWAAGEAAALGNIGGVYVALGRLADAADFCSRSLAMHREFGRTTGEAPELENLGQIHWGLGRLEVAARYHAEAAATYRRQGAAGPEARANGRLAVAYHALGRLHDARTVLTRTLAVVREFGDRRGEGHTLYCLAGVYRDLGHHTEALDFARAAAEIGTEIADHALAAGALAARSTIHHYLGDHRQAIAGFHQLLALAREIGDRFHETEIMICLAGACHSAGDTDTADDLARQALDIAREGGYRLIEGQALMVLAATHLARGEPEAAIQHADLARHVHTETGHRLGLAQAHLVTAHALRRARDTVTEADRHEADAASLFAEIGVDGTPHRAVLLLSDGRSRRT